jgi:hypothetical protein
LKRDAVFFPLAGSDAQSLSLYGEQQDVRLLKLAIAKGHLPGEPRQGRGAG